MIATTSERDADSNHSQTITVQQRETRESSRYSTQRPKGIKQGGGGDKWGQTAQRDGEGEEEKRQRGKEKRGDGDESGNKGRREVRVKTG